MLAASLSLELIIMMGLGVLIRKINMVGEDFGDQLSALVINVSLPCMILNSMAGAFTLEELKNCGTLLLLALAVLCIEFAVGQIAYVRHGRDISGRILRFGILFTNFTFMGIPMMQALYGEKSVFYFVVFLIPVRILFYNFIVPPMKPSGGEGKTADWKGQLKTVFSPPMVAVLVALLLTLLGIKLPSILADIVKSLGATSSPLGMLICGISLSRYSFRKLIRPSQLEIAVVRNLFLPALFVGLCKLISLDRTLAQVVVLFVSLPVSTMTNTFNVKYNPEYPETHFESAGSVLTTTLLSALTIPLWAAVMTLY